MSQCVITAEIGLNHNGDMNLAKESILKAHQAGVDAVKFQNYVTEDFLLNIDLTYEYQSEGKTVVESQFDMFKRYELSEQQLINLKGYCDQLGVAFFSTPTGADGVEQLVRLKSCYIKNGSDFLVNLDLIQEMAKSGIHTVLSTGMATLGEIDDAVRAFEQAGGKKLTLLHCTSAYPTPPSEVNLLKMVSLKQAFGYPVGFSDHTEGVDAAVGSVLLGATFIEKHFTIDKSLPGPDHRFSADPKEMKILVDSIRRMEQMIGRGKLVPTTAENYGRRNFRLSCVASRCLKKGEKLTGSDIKYSRPADGLPPKLKDLIVNKSLCEDIKKGDLITFNKLS